MCTDYMPVADNKCNLLRIGTTLIIQQVGEKLMYTINVRLEPAYSADIVKYRISGNCGKMEIFALLADYKNTPNYKAPNFPMQNA